MQLVSSYLEPTEPHSNDAGAVYTLYIYIMCIIYNVYSLAVPICMTVIKLSVLMLIPTR